VQVALDLESVDYEGTMAAKLRLCRRIFDTVGHKSLQTQGFKVREAITITPCISYAAAAE
jgi:hypothetical protein